MSWKRVGVEHMESETGYYWLYDRMFDAVSLEYLGWDFTEEDLDPDFTHWMADSESPEEHPAPPEDDD